MQTMTEKARRLAFLLSEGNGSISRDVVTILSGSGVLEPGTVLGKVTASGKYKPATATGTDGAETAIAVLTERVDTSSADAEAVVISRLAEVKRPMLVFGATIADASTEGAAVAQLSAATIIAR